MTNAKMPEAPAEVLEVPHGLLSRTRDSDAAQQAHAVGASLEHLRPWLSWATEEVADVQLQRKLCREAGEARRKTSSTTSARSSRTRASRRKPAALAALPDLGPGRVSRPEMQASCISRR